MNGQTMIKIEKVKHMIEIKPYSRPPGYVDVFHSNDQTYMAWYYKNFSKIFLPLLPDHIQIGLEYGLEGKPIHLILSEEPDDTIYEIDYYSISLLPSRLKKRLLKNHRILITEFMEMGMFNVDEHNMSIVEQLRNEYDVREIIEHDSGPMFALFTYNRVSEQFPNKEFLYEPKTLALVPARKPRDNRVKFLAKLYEQGLLEHCDWSLTYVEDPPDPKTIKYGNADFFKSPNVNASRFRMLKESKEDYLQKFYNDHKDILPKSFDMTNNLFSDTSLVAEDWFGNYTFKIALETQNYTDPRINQRYFVTEKTFKGFMLGLPTMVLGPIGVENTVSNMGFEFPNFEYDLLDGDKRIDKMISFLKQEHIVGELRELAERNFVKMWDKKFLIDLVVERFE